MGRASVIQIDELASCSYQPLADAMTQICRSSSATPSSASGACAESLAAGHDPADAQASVNYWYRRVADTFGRAGSAHYDTYRRFGLRQHAQRRAARPTGRPDVAPIPGRASA